MTRGGQGTWRVDSERRWGKRWELVSGGSESEGEARGAWRSGWCGRWRRRGQERPGIDNHQAPSACQALPTHPFIILTTTPTTKVPLPFFYMKKQTLRLRRQLKDIRQSQDAGFESKPAEASEMLGGKRPPHPSPSPT